MHTQASFKSETMFSGAVVIVGGSTVLNQVLPDAWVLIRSGFREWTCNRIEMQPGPNDFTPPLIVFKRKAVRVGSII